VQDTAQLAGIPAGFVQLASDAASKAGVKVEVAVYFAKIKHTVGAAIRLGQIAS